MHLASRGLTFTALAAVFASAQNTWSVPNGADPTPYVNQAQPGDILRLSAWHPTLRIDKGLVVLGAPGGTQISANGFGSNLVQVTVPAGQRASLNRLAVPLWSGVYVTQARLELSGEVSLAEVQVGGFISAIRGAQVLQRSSAHVLRAEGATLSLCDCRFTGIAAGTGVPGNAGQPGIVQSGGALLGSRVVVAGGAADGRAPAASQPALRASGGQAWFTDSSFRGGDGIDPALVPGLPGSPAILGNGGVAIARCALVDGAWSVQGSAGHQAVDAMVGMSSSGPPALGATLRVTAIAGSSQELLAIVCGFDRQLANLAPIVEPFFLASGPLLTLALSLPAAGAAVPVTTSIPNLPSLTGAELWFVAVQVAGPSLRASSIVGGVID